MRFFGGGVGHLQSLQVVHQHLEAADSESEPIESESESDMEVPLGQDDGNDPMDSDDEDTSDKGVEDSDNSSLGSGCVSDSEPEDGYDSL